MRRVVIAVPLLLLFVIAVSLTCIFTLRETEKDAQIYIDAVEQSAMDEDFTLCLTKLDEFSSFWQKRERLYLLFVRHEEMHDIEIGIEQMKGFAQCRDKSSIIGELRMLETMLSHISMSELPLIENIV